jgi:predicted outer membrane protein
MIRSWLPRFSAALAIVGCSVATAAFAASPLTAGDKSFVDRAFTLNTTAIARAHVAASSADNYVLDYTEAIIGDRNAANDQLAPIAQSAGYRSPDAPRPEAAPATARPADMGAMANDKRMQSGYTAVAYFEKEVAANTAAVALYRVQAANGSNTSLRSYAKNFLPKMQGELKNATHLLSVERGLHPQH